jgi:protocatechuate 3,4-dioxygenase beta subunit
MVAWMKPLLPSARRDTGRRDFLAWMLAVPAVAGCSVSAAQDEASAPTRPSGTAAVDGTLDASDADVAETESDITACRATTRDAEGPYFEPGSPQRGTLIAGLSEPGVRLLVEGRLLGPDCRTPLRGYAIDLWQADASGNYYDSADSAYRLRGKIVSDDMGRYRFETVLPGRYGDAAGIRPAHLHAKILTPGGNTLLTTQLYFAGDPYLGEADYCTRQRTCNSSDAKRALRLADATVSGKAGKRATFNAFLART